MVVLDSISVTVASVSGEGAPPPPPQTDYSQLIGVAILMAIMGMVTSMTYGVEE